MKILLVGTYSPNQQYSMHGFAAALHDGLSAHGCEPRLITPRVVFGRFGKPHSGIGKWLGHADQFALFPSQLRRALAWADVVHLIDHGNAVYVKHLRSVPHIVTCNDLIAAKAAFGEIDEWSLSGTARVYQRMILDGLRAAQHVVCISEATRQDVLRLAHVPDKKTSLIYDSLFQPYSPMSLSESAPLLREMGLSNTDPFLVHVGRDVPTKNRLGVIKIFHALHQSGRIPNVRMVMAGKPLSEDIKKYITQTGLSSLVSEHRHLSFEQLRALYSRATALVFPSLYEGFGMPIIEAQACGCPVFTSDRAPMTEVGGTAAVYFDPTQPEQAARVIADNLGAAARMAAAGRQNVLTYATERMVDDYYQLYKRLLTA